MKEFPDKPWSRSVVERLLQKIDSTGSSPLPFVQETGGNGKGVMERKGNGNGISMVIEREGKGEG